MTTFKFQIQQDPFVKRKCVRHIWNMIPFTLVNPFVVIYSGCYRNSVILHLLHVITAHPPATALHRHPNGIKHTDRHRDTHPPTHTITPTHTHTDQPTHKHTHPRTGTHSNGIAPLCGCICALTSGADWPVGHSGNARGAPLKMIYMAPLIYHMAPLVIIKNEPRNSRKVLKYSARCTLVYMYTSKWWQQRFIY